MSLAETFRGRRVLVTGHTGFKGSWLCLWLNRLGAEVTGFALPPATDPSHFGLLRLGELVRHVEGDIREPGAIARAVGEAEPEFVFHLAAQPIVHASYADPLTTYSTNVMGGALLLDAVRQSPGVRSLVFVTSDKCYRDEHWVWGYRETDRLGGHDPYSASKACAELVFASYADAFFAGRPGFGAATARAGNVVGGGDWSADRIVPDCVRAVCAGEPVSLRSPAATRPWQHVLDPLHGYLLLAQALYREPGPAYGGAWNFGPDASAAHSVERLVAGLIRSWDEGSYRVASAAAGADAKETQFLQLNSDRAARLLSWRARMGFEAMIEATAAWYRAWREGGNMREAGLAQIADYESSLPGEAR